MKPAIWAGFSAPKFAPPQVNNCGIPASTMIDGEKNARLGGANPFLTSLC